MTEEQIRLFKGFTLFERKRHLQRLMEAKKRAVDVVTLDGRYLKWSEFLNEEEHEDSYGCVEEFRMQDGMTPKERVRAFAEENNLPVPLSLLVVLTEKEVWELVDEFGSLWVENSFGIPSILMPLQITSGLDERKKEQ
jgi:hypothetical protein